MRQSTGTFRGHLLTVVFWTVVGFGWLAFVLVKGHAITTPGTSDYRVHVFVPTSASLAPGARVTVAGVEVGKIDSIHRNGFGARVDLDITDDRVTPLPVDSRALIRQHTPVGENYVAITPGRSTQTLAGGGVLPATQTDEYVDVDTLLSTLKGRTRQHARDLVNGIGYALEGRGGELNTVVGQGADAASNLSALGRILDGDRAHVSRLVEQLGNVASAIGERGAAIDTIARRGMVGLTALRSRDEALAQTLDALPATFDRLRTVAGAVRSASARATPVLGNLASASREVRPAVRALPSATREGRDVLTALGAAAPGLTGTLNGVTAMGKPLSAALPTVRTTMCQLNPMLRYIRPRVPDTLAILIGLGSASNSYDATGHLIRLDAILNDNSLAGQPDQVERASQDLLHSGLFGASTALSYDPYPQPGAIGTTHAVNGGPIGPSEVESKLGYKYPHVVADC